MISPISLFGVALAGDTTPELQQQCAQLGAALGYAIHPSCCTAQTHRWLSAQQANVNSTFYQTWQDVTSKSRLELFVDQLLHYASAYGTGFTQGGNGYVPNAAEAPEFTFEDYKVISPITPQELAVRCVKLGTSGINLAEELVAFCATSIVEAFVNDYTTDDWHALIEGLTCRELQTVLYAALGFTPRDKFTLLRYICQQQLGQPMIVQSQEQIQQIKQSPDKFDFTTLSEQQVIDLSSIFLRYKNWLLAFKNEHNAPILNKMRRLAKKTHTPLKPGFWETLLSVRPDIEVVKSRLSEVSVFKRVQLYVACKERLLASRYRGFLIRNQKFYWRDNALTPDVEYLRELMHLLVQSLRLDQKVRLPRHFRLAVPTSEKSFIGNLPLGTAYNFADTAAFMGIYWRNEWGTHDFDLHFFDQRGHHIGWNSDFRNNQNSVIFSGDMTDAAPEATELMYMAKGCPEGFLSVARFNGLPGSRFDIILGSEPITQMELNYMVDPRNIHLRVECTSDVREQTCGYVKDNQFVLMSFKTGDARVPGNPSLINILAMKAQTFLYLDEICEVVPDDYEGDDFIDLSGDLAKDTIINLMQSEGRRR